MVFPINFINARADSLELAGYHSFSKEAIVSLQGVEL